MSGSLNKVMIIGNLGRDPEIRTVPSGAKVANFNVATNESYNDKSGQRVEKTEWHRIVFWRGLADVAERFLKKGSTVFIEGKLSTRSWEDNNGQKRYSTEIVGDNLQILSGRADSGGAQGSQYQNQADSDSSSAGSNTYSEPVSQTADDDLPF